MFHRLKSTIRTSIIPLAKLIPLSPNTLTVIGLLISILTAIIFAQGYVEVGGIFLLLSGVFDMLDGAVARASNRMTAFGAVLDSVCDRYADAIIFVGIIHGLLSGEIMAYPLFLIPEWLWCSLALIGSYLVSYTRARSEAAGAKSMDIGFAERPERMILLVIGAFTGYLVPAIALIVILTHITSLQRLIQAERSLKNTP
ncbi:MAG: CDP-alcohol phosphatidyltransferase family protein [Methanomethylovorans sp.]|nr:CDP-alcohol phosphatidyltransferase family protein [Methanomethylovorans sp.]